jgi:hypothetical protein
MPDKMKKMLLVIPEDLHAEFKIAAATLHTTMSKLLREKMEETIAKTKKRIQFSITEEI